MWSDVLHPPSRSETVFVVVPLVAVVLQWALLGLLVGVWRLSSRHGSAP